MPEAVSVLMWLLIPVIVPAAAWIVLSRRAKADPNAKVGEGVAELRRFRNSLSDSNPDAETDQ